MIRAVLDLVSIIPSLLWLAAFGMAAAGLAALGLSAALYARLFRGH